MQLNRYFECNQAIHHKCMRYFYLPCCSNGQISASLNMFNMHSIYSFFSSLVFADCMRLSRLEFPWTISHGKWSKFASNWLNAQHSRVLIWMFNAYAILFCIDENNKISTTVWWRTERRNKTKPITSKINPLLKKSNYSYWNRTGISSIYNWYCLRTKHIKPIKKIYIEK